MHQARVLSATAVMLAAATLSSCSKSKVQPTADAAPIPIASALTSVSPTKLPPTIVSATPTPTPPTTTTQLTATPRRTPTATPTPTPTPTRTPIASPTPTPTPSPAGAPTAGTITIKNFGFSALTIGKGGTITVKNLDSAHHTVTDDGGAFDQDSPGNSTTTFIAPSVAKSYSFTCTIHPTMHGTLTVK